MDKMIVMNEIDITLGTYCDGCFLKKQLSKDHGKTVAHRFCITKCTIGDHLKFLGDEMNKFSK
jgi:hypothetical protein